MWHELQPYFGFARCVGSLRVFLTHAAEHLHLMSWIAWHSSCHRGTTRYPQICCIGFFALAIGAANAADRPNASIEGCLGNEIHSCERSFSRVLTELGVDETLDQQLKTHTTIYLSGRAPNISGSFTLRAEIGQNNRVTAALIILPLIPSVPTTEVGYGKSGLYETVVILLGSSCAPSRDAIYRLFDEKIKPTLNGPPNRSQTSGTYFELSKTIPFCEHLLTYSTLFGTDPYHLTLKAPPGSFVFPLIAVQ